MSFGQALLDSLLGIAIVFFALILLMLIIKLLWLFTGEKEAADSGSLKLAHAEAADMTAEAAQALNMAGDTHRKEAAGTAGELKLYDTPPRTAAMLMAIVADELKTPLNELRFISIREVSEK